MADKYETLTELYDNLLRGMVPYLTKDNVDRVVEDTNGFVRLFRPMDWAFGNSIGEIIEITSDKEKVIYREGCNFGHYHVVPFNEARTEVSRMIEKAIQESKQPYTNNVKKDFVDTTRAARYEHAQNLLERLEELRKK